MEQVNGRYYRLKASIVVDPARALGLRPNPLPVARPRRGAVRLRSDRARRQGPALVTARGPQARTGGSARLEADGIVFNAHYDGDGVIVFRHACKLGCEGKRLGSAYRGGRVDYWLDQEPGGACGKACGWLGPVEGAGCRRYRCRRRWWNNGIVLNISIGPQLSGDDPGEEV